MSRLIASLQHVQPNYADIGATLAGKQPKGFHHDRYEVVLGNGSQVFQRAVRGLKTWKAHAQPGIKIFPMNEQVSIGATVVVSLGTPVAALAAPCRVVGILNDETRWGFAYGTLPGHPEQGEEAFIVSISPDQSVLFEIVAFSRPGNPLVRFSGPIGRSVQRAGTTGYLRALKRYVNNVEEGPIPLA